MATALKGQKANKIYSSRTTRWVDRLIPSEIEVIHGPGRTLGVANYLSRNPTPQTDNAINANTLSNERFTIYVISERKNSILTNHQADRGARQPITGQNETSKRTI